MNGETIQHPPQRRREVYGAVLERFICIATFVSGKHLIGQTPFHSVVACDSGTGTVQANHALRSPIGPFQRMGETRDEHPRVLPQIQVWRERLAHGWTCSDAILVQFLLHLQRFNELAEVD